MIFFSASHIIFNLLLTRNGSYIIGSLCRVATAQAINVRCRLKQRKKFEPWKGLRCDADFIFETGCNYCNYWYRSSFTPYRLLIVSLETEGAI